MGVNLKMNATFLGVKISSMYLIFTLVTTFREKVESQISIILNLFVRCNLSNDDNYTIKETDQTNKRKRKNALVVFRIKQYIIKRFKRIYYVTSLLAYTLRNN